MSDTVELAQESQQEAVAQSASFLDMAVEATKSSENNLVEQLLKGLSNAAVDGAVVWDKNVTRTLKKAQSAVDQMISQQLNEIMHNEAFQKLEGSWRGLQHLVDNTETGSNLSIKMFDMKKLKLHKDLTRAVEFDQSQMFKKIYESEFGTPGGKPYGVMIGDYEFSNHPQDLDILEGMAGIGAASFCPFLTAPAPGLFDLESWDDLTQQRDLETLFGGKRHIQWRAFRKSDDAKFVVMTLPRVLARKAYGKDTMPVESFQYEEIPAGEYPSTKDFCWHNSAYALGACLTNAFAQYGWCTAIRGSEGGGKIDNLPVHTYIGKDGDQEVVCPSEVLMTERRSTELDKLGFMPLSNFKDERFSVFFGGETVQQAPRFDDEEASENAQISARLPYILATSRVAHYLKVIARPMIGKNIETAEIERDLQKWIMGYVNTNEKSGHAARAERPFRNAKIMVEPVPGQAGAYQAVAYLQPWLQMESLTASLRTVARIPEGS